MYYQGPGFGTLEVFETITLVQPTKVSNFPIIMGGTEFWNPL
jgi:predicted Rossmann-fold nucleotide-binding protein